MKKTYIKVKPLPDMATKSRGQKAEQHDKEARIIALAEKLHVKIGGK